MITPIQNDMEVNGWMTASEFGDIIAISQMTPGPLAVNAATYVGVKMAGIPGSFAATLGVSLPSFILIIIIAHFFNQFKENAAVQSILKTIKPITIGMIASAVVVMAKTSILKSEVHIDKLYNVITGKFYELYTILDMDIAALIIFVLILVSVMKFKLHPIGAVLLSAFLGILFIQV